jgi:hypothetical protein
MLLITKIAKARKADRDLSMVTSILPRSNMIECGNNRLNALNAEPESFQSDFAEIGKWLRANFVGARATQSVHRPASVGAQLGRFGSPPFHAR